MHEVFKTASEAQDACQFVRMHGYDLIVVMCGVGLALPMFDIVSMQDCVLMAAAFCLLSFAFDVMTAERQLRLGFGHNAATFAKNRPAFVYQSLEQPKIANAQAFDEERIRGLLRRTAAKGCKTAADNLDVLRHNRGEGRQ